MANNIDFNYNLTSYHKKKIKEIFNQYGFYTRGNNYIDYLKAIFDKIFFGLSFRQAATNHNLNYMGFYKMYKKLIKTNCFMDLFDFMANKLYIVNTERKKIIITNSSSIDYKISDLEEANDNIKNTFFNWVKHLDLEKDGEDGLDLLEWLNTKSNINKTYIAYDSKKNKIIGTISIKDDDRDIGKKYNISCPFIGGFIVDKKYRLHLNNKADNYAIQLLKVALYYLLDNNYKKVYIITKNKKFIDIVKKAGGIIFKKNINLYSLLNPNNIIFKNEALLEINNIAKLIDHLKTFNLL